jgi:MFS family permease
LWARASDRFGRRPVLILGPLGLAIAMIGFGLSKEFWSLVFFRGLQGVFNGNIGVSKTVLAELSDPSNMAYAFSGIAVVWNVGMVFGYGIVRPL